MHSPWEPEDLASVPAARQRQRVGPRSSAGSSTAACIAWMSREPPSRTSLRGRCTWTDDLLVIRCDIRAAQFHDGTPLTAEDVAFTYELLASDSCRRTHAALSRRGAKPSPWTPTRSNSDCASPTRRSSPSRWPTCSSSPSGGSPTPTTPSEPELEPPTRTTSRPVPKTISDSAGGRRRRWRRLRTAAPGRDCGGPRISGSRRGAGMSSVLGRTAGSSPALEAAYLARVLGDAAASLRLDGLDAIAAAYRILDLPPVGTGPWKVVEHHSRSIDDPCGLRVVPSRPPGYPQGRRPSHPLRRRGRRGGPAW